MNQYDYLTMSITERLMYNAQQDAVMQENKPLCEENDLLYHALNYRGASTENAALYWRELQACVERLILAEREACANIAELCYDKKSVVRFIRDRSNVISKP